MVEWVNVAEEARVGLEEVMIEANEILASLPLARHNLILALLLPASPQKERERGGKKHSQLKRNSTLILHVTCYTYSREERQGMGCQIHSIIIM